MKKKKEINRIEANLPQEKIDFINDVHAKEVDYWERIALEDRSEDEKRQLRDLARLEVSLARKDAGKSRVENIHEMLFYLRKIIQLIQSQLVIMPFRKMVDFHSKNV